MDEMVCGVDKVCKVLQYCDIYTVVMKAVPVQPGTEQKSNTVTVTFLSY